MNRTVIQLIRVNILSWGHSNYAIKDIDDVKIFSRSVRLAFGYMKKIFQRGKVTLNYCIKTANLTKKLHNVKIYSIT